ncbi:hypothetical protein BGW38_008275, partial [Lunasporangiospora selenospora]
NLAITCKRLRSIALDGPLRRHILLIRTPARLKSFLSARPSRDTLVHQNILRGVQMIQHIRQGHYINGDTSVQTYLLSCRLERQLLSLRINRKLKTRPHWNELVERGLIPEELFVGQEEYEAAREPTDHQHRQKPRLQLRPKASPCQDLPWRFEEGKQSDMDHPVAPAHSKTAPPIRSSFRGQGLLPELSSNHLSNEALHTGNSSSSDSMAAFHGKMVNRVSLQSITVPVPPPPPPFPSKLPLSFKPSPYSRRQRRYISLDLVPKIELLRRAMGRDRLSRLVQKRPTPAELYRSPKSTMTVHTYHLMGLSSISPDLIPMSTQLSFFLKGEQLRHWLYQRPSLTVMLNERRILKNEVRTAWMVCPGVNPKVRFFEGLIQEQRLYQQQQQTTLLERRQFLQ